MSDNKRKINIPIRISIEVEIQEIVFLIFESHSPYKYYKLMNVT